MASVSVVGPGPGPGPHRAGSEPFFKVTSGGGGRKKTSTREKKMMFRKNSSSTTSSTELPGGAAPPPEKKNNHQNPLSVTSPPPPGRGARDTAVTGGGGGGGMPGRSRTSTGDSALPLPAHAPRSAAAQGAEDRCCGVTGGSRGSAEEGDSDCNSNHFDCPDSNLNTGGVRTTRTSSLKGKAVTNVAMPVAQGANNGHNKANGWHHHTFPQVTTSNGQRGATSGATGATSSATPVVGTAVVGVGGGGGGSRGGLSLDRLTQGRTGVVRYARSERPRLEAWSIFPSGLALVQDDDGCEPDPRVPAESGEGHRFEPKPVTLPLVEDWCDGCSRQITSHVALKCRNCSYTCHLECESRVQLDCNQRDGEPPRGTPSPRSHHHRSTTGPQHKQNEAKENEVSGTTGTKALSEEEVRSRIEEYNAQVSENGPMKLASDGSYTGFIKVHLRLSRPVTVPERDPGRPPASAASGEDGGTAAAGSESAAAAAAGDRRTSFYLPSDCVKQLHIASFTTVKEVIQGLLKKFMVLDNPRKFALYRQTHRDGQDLFQKLPLTECPLALRLAVGTDSDLLTFVLKENESTEVEWHAFSVHELQNFLVILEKEEAARVQVVEHKYGVYRQKLQRALQQHNP